MPLASRVRVADDYVEVSFAGEIDAESLRRTGARLSDEQTAAVAKHGRVLFDFSEIESFGFAPQALGAAMQRLAGQGVRLAVYSSNPRFFGIGRQIALYSGVEGEAIAVFQDRAEALGWLLERAE
jgi:anti-anti-sigma regulatory factor